MATDNIETSTNDGTKENHNDKGQYNEIIIITGALI